MAQFSDRADFVVRWHPFQLNPKAHIFGFQCFEGFNACMKVFDSLLKVFERSSGILAITIIFLAER
eukprot:8337885-Heterocapsa_arctica.AAC.1